MAFTYFFRDMQTLGAVVEHALPVLKGHRYIHVWDAGCAHGPETYSLAILLREHMGRFLFRNVRIHATDVDGSNLFGPAIEEASYPEQEIARIPAEIFQKYFEADNGSGRYRVVEKIRRSVTFCRHDLLTLEPVRTGFGLVLCKNVLLHFTEGEREAVLWMFHAALREDGFLAMEQTQKLPAALDQAFEQVSPRVQMFRKKNDWSPERARAPGDNGRAGAIFS